LADARFLENDYRRLFEFTTEKVDDKDEKDDHDNDEECKKKFNKFDFLDYFESKRFSTVFMTYRWMDYWAFFDTLAQYGHIFNNFIIVIIAIEFHVTFFMAFNICCVCLLYTLSTLRLSKRAYNNYIHSGL